MQTPQPKWIIIGGCSLAFLAAALNASFMIQIGTSVSHLTGDLSRFAVDAAADDDHPTDSLTILAVALAGFVAGAIFAGIFIHHMNLDISRPYGRSIMVIGLILLASSWALESSVVVAVLLAAIACGLQNALATHFRGIILRTTHITGLLTDIGVLIGMRIRGREITGWKIMVPVSIVSSFFLGALSGAALTFAVAKGAVPIIGLTYLASGGAWSIIKRTVLMRQETQDDHLPHASS
jgi:uncharacterized membrane protein YoaK (UPF0700 family)